MKIYFLSQIPSALVVGGAYMGVTFTHPQFAEITPSDNLFVEFLPEHAHPIRFFLTEDLRVKPPEGCDVYLYPEKVVIYAKDFLPYDTGLQLIAGKRLSFGLITLFYQGGMQLCIEGESLITVPLKGRMEKVEILEVGECIFLKGERLIILQKDGTILFDKPYYSFEQTGNTITVSYPLFDSFTRQARVKWEVDSTLRQIEYSLLFEKKSNAPILYAFFETMLAGGDVSPFLCDELLTKKEELPSFFGEIKEVVFTERENVVGLVKEKAPHLFEVEYCVAEIKEDKIVDFSY